MLGTIKFKEAFTEFEENLSRLDSADDKIALLEREVFQNLNTPEDLKNAPYLAINIIALLHRESLVNVTSPSATSTERLNKLKAIADRLQYEILMIGIVENMSGQVIMTREAFARGSELKMKTMRTWPDFVIETTQSYLQEMELDKKYSNALLRVIEEAKRCKQELGIDETSDVAEQQQETHDKIKGKFTI